MWPCQDDSPESPACSGLHSDAGIEQIGPQCSLSTPLILVRSENLTPPPSCTALVVAIILIEILLMAGL